MEAPSKKCANEEDKDSEKIDNSEENLRLALPKDIQIFEPKSPHDENSDLNSNGDLIGKPEFDFSTYPEEVKKSY